MYCGTSGGKIFQFDTRKTNEPTRTMKCSLTQPIHSLHAFKGSNGETELLAASFNMVTHWRGFRQFSVQTNAYQLPFDGICHSMSLDQNAKQMVLSSRAKENFLSTHAVVNVPVFANLSTSSEDTPFSFSNIVSGCSYRNMTSLARTAIWTQEGCPSNSYIASGDTISKGLNIWQCGREIPLTHIPYDNEPILDVKHRSDYLATVSSSLLRLYCLN